MSTSKEHKHIAIIGHGYVGQAVEDFFKDRYRISLYDPGKGLDDKNAVSGADLAVICVPTPMSDDGTADLSHIESTFAWLDADAILIKSTIPPGTTASLIEKYGLKDSLVFSPEYIGERGYPVPFWQNVPDPVDMKRHHFFIFGGSKTANKNVIPFFEEVAGPHAQFVQTDPTTAELTKYTENAWLATKVTFCNELYDVATVFDVDYKELRELWLLDGRVNRSHTVVYENKRGFGGKCLPKDVNAIVHAAAARGYDPSLLRSVLSTNKRIRAREE